MKIIFASDSFKGSLSATRITQLLQEEAEACFPGMEGVCVPVADGGRGHGGCVAAGVGRTTAKGAGNRPPGRKRMGHLWRNAPWSGGNGDGTGFGHYFAGQKRSFAGLLPGEQVKCWRMRCGQGHRKSCWALVAAPPTTAVWACWKRWVCDSMTPTGTSWPDVVPALGKVSRVDLAGMLPQVRAAHITVICDVSNPLLGPTGATAVYGPQKGVTPELMPVLEAGMANYAHVLEHTLGCDLAGQPGYGAAGGMGAALGGVLGASLRRGIDAVMDAVNFDGLLEGADLVITGEGCLDRQSVAYGKVIAGIAERADRKGVPVCALVGSMRPGAEAFLEGAPGHSTQRSTVQRCYALGDGHGPGRDTISQRCPAHVPLAEHGNAVQERKSLTD